MPDIAQGYQKVAWRALKTNGTVSSHLMRAILCLSASARKDPCGQPKSLIRMFGPRGNLRGKNLFSVTNYLQVIGRIEGANRLKD
jgi:hypothetical protein